MVVFPHPDDETMATGGLLLVAHHFGWKTIVISLTKGDAGRLHINPKGKSIGELRVQELSGAAKILKVSKLIIEDFGDGKLKGKRVKVESYLKQAVKTYRPGILVTYDHSGLTGHPDHIALSVAVKEVISKLPDKPTLLWVTLPKTWHNIWHPRVAQYVTKPTHVLDLGHFVFGKYLAAKSHRSQVFTKPFLPLILLLLLRRKEWYHKVAEYENL